MRDFFIGVLDKLIGVFVVIALLAVILGSISGFTGAGAQAYGMYGGSIGAGLAILVGGVLYVCFIAGFMYLGLGIYHNTRRTADATEKLLNK
jgi:uncharacterized membrane protein